MILSVIALAGALVYGYKELKKTETIELPNADKPTAAGSQTAMAKHLNNLFDDINRRTVTNKKKRTGIKKQTEFQKESQKNFVAVSSALALSTAGKMAPSLVGLNPLSAVLVLYGSRAIHINTFKLLKQGKVNVNTLMTITITFLLLRGGFFVASLISFLIHVSFMLTERVVYKARQQLTSVFDQYPEQVWIVINGVEVNTPFEDLKPQDIVVVYAGEIVPADGVIIEGAASIDQHILTGEAQPVEKEVDDMVFSSTLVLSGKIYIRVEKAGAETTVAKITSIMENTVDFKSTTQLRAESFSERLVKPVFAASAVALPLTGIHGMLAVMSTHPKNKTMILSPIAIMNHLQLASKQGILIKDGRSLELLNKVDTLVFDKTGTLTEEQPHVGQIHCCNGASVDTILSYAAAAEFKQTHPVAKAILKAAKQRKLTLPSIEQSEYQTGYGLIVQIDGQKIRVGSQRFIQKENIIIPNIIFKQQTQAALLGYSLVLVAMNDKVIGAIELLPTVRPEAKALIKILKTKHGIKTTYIISGDHEAPTKALAQELGIDHYFGQVLPQDKAALIEQLKAEGRFVCYIGDGINDAIALKTAQVSISLQGASSAAIDTAQIILMDQGLTHLDYLFTLAEEFKRNTDTTFAILLIPTVLGLSGAFLLGFGITQTVALNLTGLAFGIGNSMRPVWSNNKALAAATPPKQLEHTKTTHKLSSWEQI